MTSKFDTYDLFGILVPGLLLIGCVAVLFSNVEVGKTPFPDAFGVVLLTALAVFAGHFVQAIASVLEPIVFRSWGGRPSDLALSGGLGSYLPSDTSGRVKDKLATAVGGSPDDHSLFLYAIQLSDGQNVGRARRFSSLYAYHRALFTVVLLCIAMGIASMVSGTASGWSVWERVGFFVAGCGLAILFWHRARQQACYYVREVLLSAEHALDNQKRKDSKPKTEE